MERIKTTQRIKTMEWCDPKLIKLSDKDPASEKAAGLGCANGNSDDFNCGSGGAYV